MKRTILFAVGALGAFFIWQWWLSRQNDTVFDTTKAQKQSDKIGRGQEILNLLNRPRIASDEQIEKVGPIMTQMNGLWSRIFPSEAKTEDNPLIYGFGRN